MRAVTSLTLLAALVAALIQVVSAADAPATRPRAEQLIVFSSDGGGAWASGLSNQTAGQPISSPSPRQANKTWIPPSTPTVAVSCSRQRVKARPASGGMARDGSDAKRICDGDQGGWSPDGRKIVLRRGGKLMTRAGIGKGKGDHAGRLGEMLRPIVEPGRRKHRICQTWADSNALYMVPADGGTPTKVFDNRLAVSRIGRPVERAWSMKRKHTCSLLTLTGRRTG